MTNLAWARETAFRAIRGHENSSSLLAFLGEDLATHLWVQGRPAHRRRLESLRLESDPHLLASELLDLARQLEADRRPDLAAPLYQTLANSPQKKVAERAALSLQILTGQGSFSETAESALGHFAEQALDPAPLIGMFLGTSAYRLVRMGALQRFGPGMTARTFASLAGFCAEVPAFTLGARAGSALFHPGLSHENQGMGRELSAAALLIGSLKMTGALGSYWRNNRSVDRRIGLYSEGLLPAATLFAGISLGHRLETAAGLRESRSFGGTLAEDLATFFQFQIAGDLSRKIFGKKWAAFEHQLDQRTEQLSNPLPPSFGPEFSMTGPRGWIPPRESRAIPISEWGLSLMVGKEITPPPIRARRLAEGYLARFPPDSEGYYSSAILEIASRIPCNLPEFHERLLEALFHSSNRGTKAQLFAILAIEDLFSADAMRTATGSFDYATMQLLIGQTAAESERGLRVQSFHKIFTALETGLERSALQDLILQLPYEERWAPPTENLFTKTFWELHHHEVTHAWASYRPQDAALLLNFIYSRTLGRPDLASRMIRNFGEGRRRGLYRASDIEGALDYARHHPLGNLVLQRLHDILTVQDVPGKLAELASDPGPIDTSAKIDSLRSDGLSPEKIAYHLNGTEHTGYLNDLRLARKVVSVMQEIGPYLENPKLRSEGRRQLVEAFWDFAQSGRPLQAQELLALLRLRDNPATEAFFHAWRLGQVEIRIVAPEDFHDFVRGWNPSQTKTLALTVSRHGNQERDVILIPDLPPFDLETTAGQDLAFHEWVNRAKSLAHEAEHWRHSNGIFFGVEAPSHPILLSGMSRQERLVSEVMAYLEEFRWRVRFCDADFFELSRRLGLSLPTYLRNVADLSYFGKSNQDRAQE